MDKLYGTIFHFCEYIKYKMQPNFCLDDITEKVLREQAKKYLDFIFFLDLSYAKRKQYYNQNAFSWAYRKVGSTGDVKSEYSYIGSKTVCKYVVCHPLDVIYSVCRLWQIKFVVSCCQIINWFLPKQVNQPIALPKRHPISSDAQQRPRAHSTYAAVGNVLKKGPQKYNWRIVVNSVRNPWYCDVAAEVKSGESQHSVAAGVDAVTKGIPRSRAASV